MHRLIIVEGLPCSGKSTISKHIADMIGAEFYDEGSGEHPADYEFHAFLKDSDMSRFSPQEQLLIKQASVSGSDGHIVPLKQFGGELFDKLLQYKIYDFLPWETERTVMLDKWRGFVHSVQPNERYVFNCVLLQNPMCETMMRFGFDIQRSSEYISSIADIIRPLSPFVVYLHSDNIREEIEKSAAERGADWLNSVIDYHCSGAYGKAEHLIGFDGYIEALEERQRRETEILRTLNTDHTIISGRYKNRSDTYTKIIEKLN